jgi:hypothetical protein
MGTIGWTGAGSLAIDDDWLISNKIVEVQIRTAEDSPWRGVAE